MNPALIATALTVLTEAIRLVAQLRAEARRTQEWTPDQEAQFQARVQTLTSQGHWQSPNKV